MADTGTCWDRTQRRMIPREIHRPYKLTPGDQGRIRSRARSAHTLTVAEAMNEAIQYSFMSMCPCTTYSCIERFPHSRPCMLMTHLEWYLSMNKAVGVN